LALEDGQIKRLGQLMSENQIYLREMTVSSPEIENLIKMAVEAGALGAKLSGAGRGGNIIVLVTKDGKSIVRKALKMAGARIVISSILN
jgi:mevalonate kinase